MTCTASVLISADKSLRCSQLSGTDRWCANHRTAYIDNYRSYKELTNHIKASLEVIDIKNANTLTIDQLRPIVPKLREMIERRITHSNLYFAFGPQDTDDEIGHMAIIEKYTQIYHLLNPIYSKLRQEVKDVLISKQTPITLPKQREFPYYVPTKEELATIKRNKAEEAAKRIPTPSKVVDVKTPVVPQLVPDEFYKLNLLTSVDLDLDKITATAPDNDIIDFKIMYKGQFRDSNVQVELEVFDTMMQVVRQFCKYRFQPTRVTHSQTEYLSFVGLVLNEIWGKNIGHDIIPASLITESKSYNAKLISKIITKELRQPIETLAKLHVPILSRATLSKAESRVKYGDATIPKCSSTQINESMITISNIIVGRSCYDLIMKSPYILDNTLPIRNNVPLPKYFPSITEVKLADNVSQIKYKLGCIDKELTMTLCLEVIAMIKESIKYLSLIKQQQACDNGKLLKLFFHIIQYKIIKVDNEAKSRWFSQVLTSDDLFFTFTNYWDLRHVLDGNNKLFANQYIAWLTLYNIIEYLINSAKVLDN